MISYPRTIQINSKVFQLEKMGDEIKLSNGTRYIMMPIEQVQEIANKTFYDKGQFRTVDFLTLIITEENK
ncbi:hypothetical protein KHA90_07860 [Flavobacterium psychroterrae]|uniref:Uncharacterized protein n=1 Tax=Flavobacterium psychroterrae TaxID=2133767 RepID=A0ABS5P9J8_9FLAO|nr:hypothetical protein [Flavobacterium psychroterrae]MBS7230937.1 hypothetical protein [Flavobacterium psychroterrae]